MKRIFIAVLLGGALGLSGHAVADEGMWTFDHLPLVQMKKDYGFTPTKAWIAQVRGASLRMASGCSASFVSADGLVMTNQHCAEGCLGQLSSAKKSLIEEGFSAKRVEDEPACPHMAFDQLDSITDVTDRVHRAMGGKSDDDRGAALSAEYSAIEKECRGDENATRCEVVSLYQGGQYSLYKYHQFSDVRLVFAPEHDIAFFGGIPDDFAFPRYDLEVTFFRVFEHDRPAKTPAFLKLSPTGPKVGDMTFVVGNPQETERQASWAQVREERDQRFMPMLASVSEWRGITWQYQREAKENYNETVGFLQQNENTLKALGPLLDTLTDDRFVNAKEAEDASLRQWIAADPARRKTYGDPWIAMATAQANARNLQGRYDLLVGADHLGDDFYYARALVRSADERSKPDAKRSPKYQNGNLSNVEQSLIAPDPVYPAWEKVQLSWSLEKLREVLGADHPVVRKIFGRKSASELAEQFIDSTKVGDPSSRKGLWDSGPGAITSSNDPMIVLAKTLAPATGQVQKEYETQVTAPMSKAEESIAQAHFAKDGAAGYPDANFTLRLSYGKVEGSKQKGVDSPAFTDFSGAFNDATGAAPFKLPASWLRAETDINLSTPFDFVTTNDLASGSSGSPVINRQGNLVGIIFDGNLPAIAGMYAYNGAEGRSIAVDSAALLTAVRSIYHLTALSDELASGHR